MAVLLLTQQRLCGYSTNILILLSKKLFSHLVFQNLERRHKFIAISSTSGTATEVTAFSVITDYAKGIKYPLADFNITPDIAIVDPALVATLPPHLVAHTGMDALTHAIEAYVSTLNSPFTDPLAIKAIQMVNEHLIKSFSGRYEFKRRNALCSVSCRRSI